MRNFLHCFLLKSAQNLFFLADIHTISTFHFRNSCHTVLSYVVLQAHRKYHHANSILFGDLQVGYYKYSFKLMNFYSGGVAKNYRVYSLTIVLFPSLLHTTYVTVNKTLSFLQSQFLRL